MKNKYFLDYDGEIKSLGAWGGDFILAAGPENSKDFFLIKDLKIFSIIIKFFKKKF